MDMHDLGADTSQWPCPDDSSDSSRKIFREVRRLVPK